ncbi:MULTISPECIES: hypothetical protein [unclassified Pseudoalteromonas]|uniref:hypothetical protein n=1 Tax=unclassified Pseudoalteromonas TaxID=194690 RepID=UPI0020968506|nr:hypothetical protein [Pseudoalteromonas sp. XMcav2-N]MCO7190162.1 hypothetical protein [Pseudoalteromonas sp. XMcav2-N]
MKNISKRSHLTTLNALSLKAVTGAGGVAGGGGQVDPTAAPINPEILKGQKKSN